ncbi:uncharacterized protein LOC110988172 [Acanthaster planci]|uniref:Uncharacterized protein LOC110988172 n=1 Tax=Acanthaster planci TaxID=133434 RepID=A0A8B7ZQJ7_ACAPL|nr:uncharacterized protein LOC110988172 [Acanthaster planci]
MTDEQRKDSNKKSTERMAKMRARKKQTQLAAKMSAASRGRHEEKLTRAQTAKKVAQRKYWKDYKKTWRAELSAERKEEIKAQRREKAREERELLLKIRSQMREDEEKKKIEEQKKKDLEKREREELERMIAEEFNSTEGSRRPAAPRRKAYSRAKASLSKNPIIYAQTVQDLYNKASSKKRQTLQSLPCDPSTAHTLSSNLAKTAVIVSESLKKQLNKLKNAHKELDRRKRRELAATLGCLKKYKLQRLGCRLFGVSPKLAKETTHVPKYTNAATLMQDTKDLVVNYYKQNSVELPDQKTISKKTLQKTRVLEMPIPNLYKQFKNDHPNEKVGKSTFYKLRPKYIKTVGSIKFRGCLCDYCENVKLKLKAVKSKMTLEELSSITLCQKGKDQKYNNKACIERKCQHCGVTKMREHFEGLDTRKEVEWSKWMKVKEEKITKKGKMLLTKKVRQLQHGTTAELLKELEKELHTIPEHLFCKSWQQNQFSKLTSQKLPKGWCVMVLDFAENYACKTQDEVQAAHWTQDQVTVHPIITYYNCNNPTCTKPIMHSIAIISDDLNHDYHAVHAFTSIAIKEVRQRQQELTKVIRFSDGCSAQYKSKGPFYEINFYRP